MWTLVFFVLTVVSGAFAFGGWIEGYSPLLMIAFFSFALAACIAAALEWLGRKPTSIPGETRESPPDRSTRL